MLRRLTNIIKGFLGIFIKGLEKNNPEALLEVEKENLRVQIANFNDGLASHAGLVEKLLAQAKKLESEDTDLQLKVKSLLQTGKRDLAAKLALRLQTVATERKSIVEQLNDAEARYKELTKARDVSVKAAKDKIEELTRGINDLKVTKAAAELTEMANGMVSTIGSSGDTLNRLTGLVEEERNKASGRLRVAKDSTDMASIQEISEEQDTLAQIALAQFEAELGITSPSTTGESTTPSKAGVMTPTT
jgi:phage shock protein A